MQLDRQQRHHLGAPAGVPATDVRPAMRSAASSSEACFEIRMHPPRDLDPRFRVVVLRWCVPVVGLGRSDG